MEEAKGLRGSESLGSKGEGTHESEVTEWETEEEGPRLDPPVIWKQCSQCLRKEAGFGTI